MGRADGLGEALRRQGPAGETDPALPRGQHAPRRRLNRRDRVMEVDWILLCYKRK
jgi:hypothetical protein